MSKFKIKEEALFIGSNSTAPYLHCYRGYVCTVQSKLLKYEELPEYLRRRSTKRNVLRYVVVFSDNFEAMVVEPSLLKLTPAKKELSVVEQIIP